MDAQGESPVISYMQQMPAQMPQAPMARPAAAPAAPVAPPAPAAPAKEAEAAPPQAETASVDGTPLPAPMPGMIVSYGKLVGYAVDVGETVVVLEGMKMDNALPSPTGGTIKAFNYSSGDSVAKGDVLLVMG